MVSRFAEGCPFARQNNPEFGELVGLGIDLYRPGMLLDDDVMADRQAKPSAFAGRFCREERVEHLFLHVGGYAGAIVADADFDTISEVLGRGSKLRLVIGPIGL